ncbi:MAG: TonB-dependent receptor domain-containing protein [Opitutales bacterium]
MKHIPNWLTACLYIFFITLDLSAQETAVPTGSFSGLVVDVETGVPLIGASVEVLDTELTSATDLDGRFSIQGIPVGNVNVVFSRNGYEKIQVDNVVITEEEPATLELGLPRQVSRTQELEAEGVVELEAFVVEFEEVKSQNMALLLDRQKSASVSDAIGSDFLSNLGLGDAAEAMTKITGASVQDGKYVVIRGLGDRYSNTLLNGNSVPSSDPDRRAVQMDQFPSDLLDSIVTSKSFTPDQPGAFSGGSVNIKTRDFPEAWFLKLSGSIGFNTQTTGEDILVVPGGDRDFLAMDDGTRELPSGLPEEIPSASAARLAARNGDFGPAEELDAAINAFNNETYFPSNKSAAPKMGFSVALGDRIDLENDKLFGYIMSLTYDSSSSFYDDGSVNRFNTADTAGTDVEYNRIYSTDLSLYSDSFVEGVENLADSELGPQKLGSTKSTQSVAWGAFTKLAFRPSANHKMSVDIFHNQSADDTVQRGIGEDPNDATGDLNVVYDLLYTERSLSAIQFASESKLGDEEQWTMEWRASRSRSTQEQPDYRTFGYRYDLQSQSFEPRAGANSSRDFRDLTDRNSELAVDLTYDLAEFKGRDVTLKMGAAYTGGDRNREETGFRLTRSPTTVEVLENYPNPVGIEERTENSVTFANTITRKADLNTYTGEQAFRAVYGMVDTPITEKLRMVAGARYETTDMTTTPVDLDSDEGLIDASNFLPAASFVYALSDNQNIRLAYGKTIARPTYKELADIRISDNFTGQVYNGNPDLNLTVIDNFDLRWEWFPRDGEIVAASFFYKEMKDPIEVVLDQTGAITPQNVAEGTVQGIEFEFRKQLDFISDSLANFSFGTNFAYIESEVTIPDAELEILRLADPNFSDTRDLVGQSEYTFNVDTTYNNPDWGFTATIAFNMVGESLDVVTSGVLPDIYEQPAPSLDFIASKSFGENWSVKFKAQNLLDPEYEKTVDTSEGGEIIYESYTRGLSFSLGVSYSFE